MVTEWTLNRSPGLMLPIHAAFSKPEPLVTVVGPPLAEPQTGQN
jgi:hypothetical protein